MIYISERSYVNEQHEHEQHDYERHPRRDRRDCEYLTIGHRYLNRLDHQVFCACVGNKCLPRTDFSEIQHIRSSANQFTASHERAAASRLPSAHHAPPLVQAVVGNGVALIEAAAGSLSDRALRLERRSPFEVSINLVRSIDTTPNGRRACLFYALITACGRPVGKAIFLHFYFSLLVCGVSGICCQ
jgi:hypothetical protein